MTGVDGEPSPSSLIFHLMFFDSLQVDGGVASAEMPIISGPRQVGQLSAANAAEVNRTVNKKTRCEIDFFNCYPFQLLFYVYYPLNRQAIFDEFGLSNSYFNIPYKWIGWEVFLLKIRFRLEITCQ